MTRRPAGGAQPELPLAPPPPRTPDLGAAMLRWHRDAARALGSLSLAIARRRVTPASLDEWAAVLERVAREMRR